jgi:hypothetical protein
MSSARLLLISIALGIAPTVADEVLYEYEGDVFPHDASAGWEVFDACDPPCTESIEDGCLVLEWPYPGNQVNYTYTIAEPPEDPPPTLWVEWQFCSNHPFGGILDGCDGVFVVHYQGTYELINMYGDAAISFSGDEVVTGLAINELHTYRYESLDGRYYDVSVDGQVFVEGFDYNPNGYHFLQLAGIGGCISDQIPDKVNRWDFVRYGEIGEGELIVASDPPAGEVSTDDHPSLDRFTVTFDQPNYVYIDDISVEVTQGDPPAVLQTRRLVNGTPETVEIVLDRLLPIGETVTFTFPDPDGPGGPLENVVEYTLRQPVPAASTWGLVAMTLLLVTSASIVIRHQRAAVPHGTR